MAGGSSWNHWEEGGEGPEGGLGILLADSGSEQSQHGRQSFSRPELPGPNPSCPPFRGELKEPRIIAGWLMVDVSLSQKIYYVKQFFLKDTYLFNI